MAREPARLLQSTSDVLAAEDSRRVAHCTIGVGAMSVPPLAPAGRSRVFALSWLAYASYYAGRKGFSVVKVALAREFGLSTGALAAIDSGFLVAYALGQLPAGMAADRFGPRRIVAIGLALSSVACLGMGASTGALAFGVAFGCNGLAQATGWPGTTKAVAQWTTPAERGRVMGVWSTCYQIGGVAATALATWLLAHSGWRAAFVVPAAWMGGVALLVALGLRAPAEGPAHGAGAAATRAVRALRSPALYSYGAAYFCLKLIRYSLLFWLPFYLHTAAGFDPVRSGYMSTAFELGGVFGSVGLGWLSDRIGGRRAAAALGSAVLLAPALYVYGRLGSSDALTHVLGLALIGVLLFGPDALLSGAAAQDAGGDAAASAVGLVNALGSAGALLQGFLITAVEQRLGWQTLFQVFLGLDLLACLCLWPALRRSGAAAPHAPRPPP